MLNTPHTIFFFFFTSPLFSLLVFKKNVRHPISIMTNTHQCQGVFPKCPYHQHHMSISVKEKSNRLLYKKMCFEKPLIIISKAKVAFFLSQVRFFFLHMVSLYVLNVKHSSELPPMVSLHSSLGRTQITRKKNETKNLKDCD